MNNSVAAIKVIQNTPMSTFVIIPTAQEPAQKTSLSEAIKAKFGNACYHLPQGEWLVSYAGTSRQLSDELNISEGVQGNVIVLHFTGYWGRATNDVWEWMNVQQA